MDTTSSQTQTAFGLLKKGLRPSEVLYENQIQKNTENAVKFFEEEKNWLRREQAEAVRDYHISKGSDYESAARAGYNSVLTAENLPINAEALLAVDLQVATEKEDKGVWDYATVGGLGLLLGISAFDLLPKKPISTAIRKSGKFIDRNVRKAINAYQLNKDEKGLTKLLEKIKITKFVNNMPVDEKTTEVFGKKINLDSEVGLPYKTETFETQKEANLNPINLNTPFNLRFNGIDTYSPTLEAIRNIDINKFSSKNILPEDIKSLIRNIPEDNTAILNSIKADAIIDASFIEFYQKINYIPQDFKGNINDAVELIESGFEKFKNLPEKKKFFDNLNTRFLNSVNVQLTLPTQSSQSAELLVDVYDSRKSLYSGKGESQTVEYLKKQRGNDTNILTTDGVGKQYNSETIDFSQYPFNSQTQRKSSGLLNEGNAFESQNIVVIRNPSLLNNREFLERNTLPNTDLSADTLKSIKELTNQKQNLDFKYKHLFKGQELPSSEKSLTQILSPNKYVTDNTPYFNTIFRVNRDLYTKLVSTLALGDKSINTKNFFNVMLDEDFLDKGNNIGLIEDFVSSVSRGFQNNSKKISFNIPIDSTNPNSVRRISVDTDEIESLLETIMKDKSVPIDDELAYGSVEYIEQVLNKVNINLPQNKNTLRDYFNYSSGVAELRFKSVLNQKQSGVDITNTHGFGVDTIGHLRTTKVGDSIFIDEIQSDLFQQFFNQSFRRRMKLLTNSKSSNLTEKVRNNITDFYFEKIDQGFAPFEIDTKLLDERVKVANAYNKTIGKESRKLNTTTDYLDFIQEELNNGVPLDELVGEIYSSSYKDIFGKSRSKMIKEVTAATKKDLIASASLPVNNMVEIIEKLLLSTILASKKDNFVNSSNFIVLPSLERIAMARDFTNSPNNFMFNKSTIENIFSQSTLGKPKNAIQFLDWTTRVDGKPQKFWMDEVFSVEGLHAKDVYSKPPVIFKEIYENAFDKAVENIVKKSNGKIKAILGTADYSVSGHKFSSEDMISIYKTHKRIEEGKNVQELEKKLYNSFIDFYDQDNIKEPVKILDIRGILNDKDLSFTRIGMAKGGLVNA